METSGWGPDLALIAVLGVVLVNAGFYLWLRRALRLGAGSLALGLPDSRAPTTLYQRLRKLAGATPAGLIVPAILLIGLSAQVNFNAAKPNRTLGAILFLMLVPAAGLLYASQVRAGGAPPQPLEADPQTQTVSQSLPGNPRCTFLATLAALGTVLCASLAQAIANNASAAVAWFVSALLYAAAFWPNEWHPGRERLRTLWRSWRRELLVLIPLFLAASILRFYRLDTLPFGLDGDEGAFGTEALRFMAGEYQLLFGTTWVFHHTAVFTYLQVITMSIFGHDEIGLRLVAASLSVFSLLFSYLLTRRMFGPMMALVALTLIGFSPLHLMYSRMGIHDMIVMLTFIPSTIYFLYRGLTSGRAINYALAGLSLGIGLWMDYNNKIMVLIPMVLGMLGYVLVIRPGYWRTQWPKIAVLMGGALITLIPLWSGLQSLGHLWQDPARGKSILAPENLRTQMARFETQNPAVVLMRQVEYNVFALNHFPDASFLHAMSPLPMLNQITAVFCFIGAAYSLWRWREANYGLLLLWWVAGFQMGIWSEGAPQFHRLTPIIVPSCILAAAGIMTLWQAWTAMLKWPPVYFGVVVVFVVTVITVPNIRAFFNPDYYSTRWWEFCVTGKAIREWSADYQVVYVGQPFADTGHGTIEFCSHLVSKTAQTAENVSAFMPLPQPTGRNLAFIFSRGNFDDLEALRSYYPRGQWQPWFDTHGELLLQAYLISATDANAKIGAGKASP